MNQNLTAIAKDNMIRISPTKLAIIVKSIVGHARENNWKNNNKNTPSQDYKRYECQ